VKETLTDAKIREKLREEGIVMDDQEIAKVFTRGLRLHFAVHNIGNPLKAVSRCATHVKETLTDAKIREKLREEGIVIDDQEIAKVFTKGVRLHFAVHHIGNPLEAVSRCATHVKETLTDAKIREKLREENIVMSDQEIAEVFTKGVRLYFAVHNIENPLEGIVRWVKGTVTTPWGSFADYRGRIMSTHSSASPSAPADSSAH